MEAFLGCVAGTGVGSSETVIKQMRQIGYAIACPSLMTTGDSSGYEQ